MAGRNSGGGGLKLWSPRRFKVLETYSNEVFFYFLVSRLCFVAFQIHLPKIDEEN